MPGQRRRADQHQGIEAGQRLGDTGGLVVVQGCRPILVRHRQLFITGVGRFMMMVTVIAIGVGMQHAGWHACQQGTEGQQTQQRPQAGGATRDAIPEPGDQGTHRVSMTEPRMRFKPCARAAAVASHPDRRLEALAPRATAHDCRPHGKPP